MSDQQTVEATPRIREKILSIYELMLRPGTLGEYEAAKAMLEKLLKKHNLTIEDFVNQEPPKEWVWFVYHNNDEARILVQLVWMVTGKKQNKYKTFRATQRTWERGYELTKVQAVDFALLYRTYIIDFRKALKAQKAKWKQDQKMFPHAYLQANMLFGKEDGDTSEDRELTPEQAADLERMWNMARGIKKTDDPRKPGYLGDGKK